MGEATSLSAAWATADGRTHQPHRSSPVQLLGCTVTETVAANDRRHKFVTQLLIVSSYSTQASASRQHSDLSLQPSALRKISGCGDCEQRRQQQNLASRIGGAVRFILSPPRRTHLRAGSAGLGTPLSCYQVQPNRSTHDSADRLRGCSMPAAGISQASRVDGMLSNTTSGQCANG